MRMRIISFNIKGIYGLLAIVWLACMVRTNANTALLGVGGTLLAIF